MKSCIYQGTVRHRRFTPVFNAFQYRLYLMYLDLAELPHVFDAHPLWSAEHVNLAYLRRRDHFGAPHISLDRAIRDLVEEKLGTRPEGPVRMLTHLRYFGYCFNPASFFTVMILTTAVLRPSWSRFTTRHGSRNTVMSSGRP